MRRIQFTLLVLLLSAFLFSCGGGDGGGEVADEIAEDIPPYTVNAYVPDSDGTLKILLYYDMEGISGVNKYEQVGFRNPEYKTGRENLTKDVNAVIDGLFAGGADIVHVTDAHGSGNPGPDVDLERLDSRAQMLYKDASYDPYIDIAGVDQYDAVAVVAMHAKTGDAGFLAHTYNGGCDWIINGKSISETEIIAFAWGREGIPVIFATGDDVLKGQLEYMDWVEYVTVKRSINWIDAELFPLDEVHAEMREKSKKAVENLSSAKYVAFTEPLTAGLRTQFPADHSILEGVPGIDYKDKTVTFKAQNYREAYHGIEELIRVAGAGRQLKLMREYLAQSEYGSKVYKEVRTYMFKKMQDMVDGKWDPNAKPEKKEEEKEEKKEEQYFGVK
jgi:D-amino peptidase